ncbi:hypothetical protein [Tepidibacillus fermentans]|uniref:Uncharacterized protein n=1 Tax=Tepidibacillus fermentans TaxID=1281767 RepID=A0A4V6NYZ9_9BACI|nr:hypothetical protein [Tepidibacillus fermentans]TCS82963.1 hypothetical protein EDD72_10746 [Tepidibacillus fermentans]
MKSIKKRKFELLLAFSISILIFIMNSRLNLFSTAFVRSIFAFVFFYFFTWLLRELYLVFGTRQKENANYQHIELTTTQDDDQKLFEEIYQTDDQKKSNLIDFQPLEFEKIKTDEQNIEQIVKGVRVWSHDD